MNPANDYSNAYEAPNIKVVYTKRVYFIQDQSFVFLEKLIVQKLNMNTDSWINEGLPRDSNCCKSKIGTTQCQISHI